jgi:hypothetical protein
MHAAERERSVIQRVFLWPVVSLVVTGMIHLGIEAAWPDLQTFFVAPTLAPLLLAYGAWIGYRAIDAGTGYVGAVVAGAVVGLLPLGLDVIGFGLLLDRGIDHGTLAGVFGMASVTFGALLGAGFAMSGMQGSLSPR